MAYYYPQGCMTLEVKWEDFEGADPLLFNKKDRLVVLAKRMNVGINDYTQADTFSAEIDYKNFPFDPRCIRSLGVTIHIEDRKKIFEIGGNQNQNRLNLLTPNKENTVFQGFADEESISFDEVNRVVRFEGRDFTSVFIDAKYGGKALDMMRPLDQIITALMAELPAVGDMTLDNRTGESLPNLGKFAPDFQPLAAQRGSKKNETYWDVITDIVSRAGLIAFVELDKLVVTKPRVLYGDSRAYQFVYGKNLARLEFKRKIGRRKGINILVRRVNLETKEVLEARIPLEANQDWCNALGIDRAAQKIQKIGTDGQLLPPEDAPYLTFPVSDINNKERLIEVGQGIFEEVGRQQIEGSFTTKDMCTLQDEGRGLEEFEITKIRNGTPVAIRIEQGDMQGLSRLKSDEEKERYLKSRCFDPKVAAAFARSMGKFDVRFYTKAVEFSLDAERGFECKLDFINFIELEKKGIKR